MHSQPGETQVPAKYSCFKLENDNFANRSCLQDLLAINTSVRKRKSFQQQQQQQQT